LNLLEKVQKVHGVLQKKIIANCRNEENE